MVCNTVWNATYTIVFIQTRNLSANFLFRCYYFFLCYVEITQANIFSSTIFPLGLRSVRQVSDL